MSVCVGVRDRTGVYFATDSLETSNCLRLPGTHRKIGEHGGITFMTAGLSSAAYIMAEALERFDGKPYIRLGELRGEIVAAFKRRNWTPREEDGAPERYQASYILSDGRCLAEITNGGEPQFVSGGFIACGSGWIEAYAADASLRLLRPKSRAKARAAHAVQIAAQLDTYCGGEVQVLHVSRRRARALIK